MLASEIDFGSTPNLKYGDVVLGRRTARQLDPSFVVPREEILQIIREAISFTPSGGNCQPWRFLVVDTDEGKKKLDDMMRRVDVGRVRGSSFAIVPMYDREYMEGYDKLMEFNQKTLPEKYSPEHVAALKNAATSALVEMLSTEEGERAFDRSLAFQTGIVSMSLLIVLRAHGLDSGFVTDWNESLLAEEFGIDLERYQPCGPIAAGKNIGPVYDCFRFEAEELTMFSE